MLEGVRIGEVGVDGVVGNGLGVRTGLRMWRGDETCEDVVGVRLSPPVTREGDGLAGNPAG